MLSNYSNIKRRCYVFRTLSYLKYFRCREYGAIKKSVNKKYHDVKNINQFSGCFIKKNIFDRFLTKDFNVRICRFHYTSKGKGGPRNHAKLISAIILTGLVPYASFATYKIDWLTFVEELLSKGQVEKILIDKRFDRIEVVAKRGAVFKNEEYDFETTYLVDIDNIHDFEEALQKAEEKLGILESDRVVVVYKGDGGESINIVHKLSALILQMFVASLVFTFLGKYYLKDFLKFLHPTITKIDKTTDFFKKIKFSDVAGLQEAKVEVMEFTDYLKRPEYYMQLGAKIPKGALLLGPPGCGKTLLAKALASEADVPFLTMNGSEFIELIGGLGAARVRNLYSKARQIKPCIVYIDEIDSLGRERFKNETMTDESERDQTLNQLLVEMDGMDSTTGVITLASTNRADLLDQALLRPGRFDRHIQIDLPNQEERREIFLVHLKNLRLEHEPKYYANRLASLTPGFTGADIANVCNEAALHAARYKKTVVSGKDLDYAVERIIGGVEKRSSTLSTKEKHVAAYHEAGCALIGWLTEHGDILLKISVVPRTNLTIGWTQFSTNEKYLFSKEELFGKMCMALGGRAAETIIFNRISTKSEKDLRKVTRIAYAQVRDYGMSKSVGPISFMETEDLYLEPYSKQLAGLIDEESRKLIAQAFITAETVLRENKDKLVKLAEELVKRETMSYEEVVLLIGPPNFAEKKIVEPITFEMAFNAAAGPEPEPEEDI